MPDLNWNDLRVLLAVSRHGTMAAAARALRVDETTVARRLAAAEAAIGARLFQRAGNGALRPTGAGGLALVEAERAEQAVDALRAACSQADAVAAGTVRLTAVPILVNRVLVPALHDLAVRQPMLRLELIAEPRGLSLTKREADVALRLARPMSDAGAAVLARRVLDLTGLPEVPDRELWLLTHPEQRKLARVTAVVEWLDRTLASAGVAQPTPARVDSSAPR